MFYVYAHVWLSVFLFVCVLCVCVLLCLIGCGKNFVISRNRAPSCQTSSPANHQITVVFVSRHHWRISATSPSSSSCCCWHNLWFMGATHNLRPDHSIIPSQFFDGCLIGLVQCPVTGVIKASIRGRGRCKVWEENLGGRAEPIMQIIFTPIFCPNYAQLLFPLINPFLTIFADY